MLTVLLGTALKFDGKFILQTRSDGPVDMLVADFTTPRSLRAYARFDAERLAEAVASGNDRPEQLLGDGVLALTIDQGAYTQRYQGIVQLDGASLEDVARVYFRQSEQIPTDVRLSVAKQLMPGGDGVKEHWRAGGILAQFLPEAPERLRLPDLPGGDGDVAAGNGNDPTDNSWQELLALLATVEPAELVDPSVGAERLLYRLFHEHGVRVFEGRQGRRRLLLLAREDPRHPRRLLGRGDRGEHRGRRDQGQLRVLLEGLRVRPGGVCDGELSWFSSPSATCRGCRARRRECRFRRSRRGRCASCSCRP